MPSHPVIQPSPYDTFLLTIHLKRMVRSAFKFLYKGVVMPIIVILFHRCEFFCKITAFSVGCQCVIAETDTSILNTFAKNFTIIAWLVIGGTSVFAAINTYEISLSLLKPKETSAY